MGRLWVEVGDVEPGTVVELVSGTVDGPRWSEPLRAMVWGKDYYLTRVVWLDGWQVTGDDHVADCTAVEVLDETPPPTLWAPDA